MRWASSTFSAIRSQACCRPSAWGSPIKSPCARRRSSASSTPQALPRRGGPPSGLRREGGPRLAAQGVAAERLRRKARLLVRYQGTDTALSCELPPRDDVAAIRAEFEALYKRRFAFLMPGLDLVIESVTMECVGVAERVATRSTPASGPASATQRVDMYC